MAVKLILIFFIHAATASELVLAPPKEAEKPSLIPRESPPLLPQHDTATLFNNQGSQHNYDNVIELQNEEPLCYSNTVLVPIINQLLNLVMQDPSNAHKVTRITALLQEYLKNQGDGLNNPANRRGEVGDLLKSNYINNIVKGEVKTKIVFKYDPPSINQPQCKDVFMQLIKSAYDVYMQLAKDPLCQNRKILDAYYNNVNMNLNPTLPNKMEQYSIYDLLKPHLPENNKYELYQETKNVNDLTNIYASYKQDHLNEDAPFNVGIPELTTNYLDYSKLNPNDGLKVYNNAKDPFSPYYTNYYKPETPGNNLNYDGTLNPYNILLNGRKEPISRKDDSNHLFSDTYDSNLLNYNSNVPDNNFHQPLNIFIDRKEKNSNSLESILAILSNIKTPSGKDIIPNEGVKLTYPENYLNIDQTGSPIGQYPNYQNPYLYNKIVNQYGTPINPLKQMPDQNVNDPYQNHMALYSALRNLYGTPDQINAITPYLQYVYNNYFNKLSAINNMQEISGVQNAFKLDPSLNAANDGVIEFTYVVKRPTPLVYQPLYFVKFRMPYLRYLENIKGLLLTKPHLKANPLKLYQELLTLSNVSDMSPGLKGYTIEDILKLTYSSGEFVTAKLIHDDNALKEQLRLIQNLNSGIEAADILKLVNKNNGLLKSSFGNYTDILGVGRYGKSITPYYDLSSSGIGLNSNALSQYNNRQALPINTVTPVNYGTIENNVVRPTQFLSGLPSQKFSLGTPSLGLNG